MMSASRNLKATYPDPRLHKSVKRPFRYALRLMFRNGCPGNESPAAGQRGIVRLQGMSFFVRQRESL
jgi:hypothetical protein